MATSRADGEAASAPRVPKYVHMSQSSLFRTDEFSRREGSRSRNGCNSVSLRGATAGVEISGAILRPATFRFLLGEGALLTRAPTSQVWSQNGSLSDFWAFLVQFK